MVPSDTLVSLQPRITPAPTPCSPDTLVVHLSTTVVIPDFTAYYGPASIETFVPTYSSSPDGSLISSSFQQDLMDANIGLLVMGALAMVFTRNIIVSGDYIRRGRVKKKVLFYVLFLSQILAPVSLGPVIASSLGQDTSCTVVLVLSCICGATSLALLITVILGVKVYKCLNNPPFIIIVLGLFQLGSVVVVVLDIIKTRVMRRTSGSCIRTDDLRFTRLFVILQFAESLFICCCFMYVCWKSRGSPAARGRISIELSMDELPIEFPPEPVDNPAPARQPRGWWDYVKPEDQQPALVKTVTVKTPNEKSFGKGRGIMQRFRDPAASFEKLTTLREPADEQVTPAVRNSLAPSISTRLSRLLASMEYFQQAMKDELLYTTFITFNCVIVAVLVIIGVNVRNGLSVTGWIALNWCIISLLAIHSFGRVVHRNEREMLLSHPVTCTAITRAANNISRREQRSIIDRDLQDISRQVSNLPTPRSLRTARDSLTSVTNDPFADTQPLAPNRASEHEETSSMLSDRRSSLLRDGQALRPSRGRRSVAKASTLSQDFPSSSPATPSVSIKYFEKVHQREFSRSWLVSSNNTDSVYSNPYHGNDPRFSKESAAQHQ